MPILITGLFAPSGGAGSFDLYAPEDIQAGNVNVVLQMIASGAVKGGSHATAPVGEIVAQVRTNTGAPTHSASTGTFCWNSADNQLYMNNNGTTGWTLIGPMAVQYSVTQYVFVPDAGIATDVVAGAQQQQLVSSGSNETLVRIVCNATVAGGTALIVTLEQFQNGGAGVEDVDSTGSWTTVKALTVTAANKTVIDSAPAATILARGALRINISGTVAGWQNLTVTYEVKRPLTT